MRAMGYREPGGDPKNLVAMRWRVISTRDLYDWWLRSDNVALRRTTSTSILVIEAERHSPTSDPCRWWWFQRNE